MEGPLLKSELVTSAANQISVLTSYFPIYIFSYFVLKRLIINSNEFSPLSSRRDCTPWLSHTASLYNTSYKLANYWSRSKCQWILEVSIQTMRRSSQPSIQDKPSPLSSINSGWQSIFGMQSSHPFSLHLYLHLLPFPLLIEHVCQLHHFITLSSVFTRWITTQHAREATTVRALATDVETIRLTNKNQSFDGARLVRHQSWAAKSGTHASARIQLSRELSRS